MAAYTSTIPKIKLSDAVVLNTVAATNGDATVDANGFLVVAGLATRIPVANIQTQSVVPYSAGVAKVVTALMVGTPVAGETYILDITKIFPTPVLSSTIERKTRYMVTCGATATLAALGAQFQVLIAADIASGVGNYPFSIGTFTTATFTWTAASAEYDLLFRLTGNGITALTVTQTTAYVPPNGSAVQVRKLGGSNAIDGGTYTSIFITYSDPVYADQRVAAIFAAAGANATTLGTYILGL